MSVELLARHLCIPADSVEREMVRALKVLKKHGPFVLWSLDLDDEYEDVAAGLCFPLMLRLEMHQWVLKDVLRAPRSVFEPLMRNGKFWQRLRGGRYCGSRGGRRVRKNIMVAAPGVVDG